MKKNEIREIINLQTEVNISVYELNKKIINLNNYLVKLSDSEKGSEKGQAKLSNDEYVILKNIDKDIKWIARDMSENLYVHSHKPRKFNSFWDNLGDSDITVFNHLFQFVKWEDEEPYSIQELIENYEKENMND